MTTCYRITLKPKADIDELWDNLTHFGCELLYSLEETAHKEIYGNIPDSVSIPILLETYPEIIEITPHQLESIDWDSQWAIHGSNFHDGFVHIDLNLYSKECSKQIKMQPGAGFGDLSHPTTQLIMQMLGAYVKDKFVIDVGSGSGVLSLAAAKLGAVAVHGIDIDPAAIEHSIDNAKLNELEQIISFGLPNQKFEIPNNTPLLILMNMIQSEQIEAWESLPQLHSKKAEIITSGILNSDKQAYLDVCLHWGWQLKNEIEFNGWSAFYFHGTGY